MKRRWSVLLGVVLTGVLMLSATTAFAVGPHNGGGRHCQADSGYVPCYYATQAGAGKTANAQPSANNGNNTQGNAICPYHEQCPQDCAWYNNNAQPPANNGNNTQGNAICPYHEQCPQDCMWYNNNGGCPAYDAQTGTCSNHDGTYCNRVSNSSGQGSGAAQPRTGGGSHHRSGGHHGGRR